MRRPSQINTQQGICPHKNQLAISIRNALEDTIVTWETTESVGFLVHMEVKNSKITELELSLLDARDFAIGAAAELGELRYRHDKSLREIDSLVHQLNLLHGSRTWRIGRFVLSPLTALRKVLRLILK